ncbi:MAG TPA: TonB-dependent receptor [Vicinamibacterales bacterium]
MLRKTGPVIAALSMIALLMADAGAFAQPAHNVVIDQTGLPLPGVRVEIQREGKTISTLETGIDGGYDLPADIKPDDTIVIALDGFETAQVRPSDKRVVLQLARATATTTVVASALTTAGASMEHLGSTMTAPLAQRLPTPRPRILQSLPLLPGVVRGRDGLLNISGTRPHESALWIDGFDVTDPVAGTTAIDLPVESVRGMAVLREPVAATFSDVLGSAASIETTPGSDKWRAGIQGFIPRPRLSSMGFGRIEAFFPRAYVGGRIGIMRLFTSAEFNFERVPVAGVTGSSGSPNIGTTGVTTFSRFDFQLSKEHALTTEVLYAPGHTTSAGLSTLRPAATVPDVDVLDVFVGVSDRWIATPRDLLTFRVGVAAHETGIVPQGSGNPILTPEGWLNNWFSDVDVTGRRVAGSATWERAGLTAAGNHDLSGVLRAYRRSMDGGVHNLPITVVDSNGAKVRTIEFSPAGRLDPDEFNWGAGVRDLWDVSGQLQLDLGVRVDSGHQQSSVLAPRLGLRYLLDEAGRTTVRASAGRYAGRVPLDAKAYGRFAPRRDTFFDPTTGAIIRSNMYNPVMGRLPQPRADAFALELEHKLTPTLELQVGGRRRFGSKLPTVEVPEAGGPTPISGIGTSDYQEVQVSVRKLWANQSQIFVSYVHSSSRGDTNDFGTLYKNLDAPLLDRNAYAVTSANVPHRLRGWATFSLPERIVVSPAVDWRTGFPYSALDVYQQFIGAPNTLRYPDYFALDLTAFKTFDIFSREMDFGLQFFNLTAHENPRDVVAVVDSPRFGEFSASFGVTLAGYMQIRW